MAKKLDSRYTNSLLKMEATYTHLFMIGVMIAWTGIEHFHMGRYDPPPPACEPEDAMVRLFCLLTILLDRKSVV